MKDEELKTNRDLEIAFVGSVVPDDLCQQLDACSFAGNKYQLGILKGLESALSQPLHVISVKPVAMFPRNRIICSRGAEYDVYGLSQIELIPFLNILILKQITIMLTIFQHLAIWLWKNRKAKKRIILVYNVFSPYSLAVLSATTIFGGTPVAVIADLPYDLYDFKGIMRGFLQKIDSSIQASSISRFSAIIPLTRYIAEDFAPELPALVIEGGVDNSTLEILDTKYRPTLSTLTANEKIVLYSGSINEINGIDLLIEAFRSLPDSEYRLHIFGRGPLEPLLNKAMNEDKRIFYSEVISNQEMIRRQSQATVLVNPRPSSYSNITRYTFPSKVLDYIASGRPVISTALPGIPEEYYPFLHLLKDETPAGLAKLIQDVCTANPNELEKHSRDAMDFVMREKNWNRQGKKVYDFLNNL